ncbi:MAG: hypothetical protein HN731_19955 [Rhodospirillaceae bacterium]|nr:hypothetical protein [Rhodospirillaceae bacterium]MBT7957484.1 hypothetical protein [Rhodospirillaceae bacterium]
MNLQPKVKQLVWGNFLPVLAPVLVLVVGFGLMSWVNVSGLPIDAPKSEFKSATIIGQESVARYWTGLTLLLMVVVSIGAGLYAMVFAWNASSDESSRGRFIVTLGLLIAVVLFAIFGLDDTSFYEYLSLKVFSGTLGAYPGEPNRLLMLDHIIDLGNTVPPIAAAILATAVCTLVPDKANALKLDASGNQQARDEAAAQIALQIVLLKRYLGAASLVLLIGLTHMKAWRDWPLAFWPNATDKSAIAFQQLVDASISYQAVHFVCILAAIFLPIAYRLKTQSMRLAVLEHGEQIGSSHATWLSNKGLSLNTAEITQRAIAIISPFLVPAAGPAVEILKKIPEMFS